MARYDQLWRAMDRADPPPRLSGAGVKARVNAALDADQGERKIYMKQKLQAVLAGALAAAALTATAFAATTEWTGLSDWFAGSTAPAQEYVQEVSQTVQDENYSLTVDACASDGNSAYLTLTITALSDEAKEFIQSDRFDSIDLLELWIPSREDPGYLCPVGCGYRVLDGGAADTRKLTIAADGLPYPTDALYVWCGYMEEGKRVKIPITPEEPVEVKIEASGSGVCGVLTDPDEEDLSVTVENVILSPFICQVRYRGPFDLTPNFALRMADGRVLTRSQAMEERTVEAEQIAGIPTGVCISTYRFKEVQDLDNIVSLTFFGREFFLDGSKPAQAGHDSGLEPFTVTRMDPLGEDMGFSIAVRELTEKLGGTCVWDQENRSVKCTCRGVTVELRPGDGTALVDGAPVELLRTPALQNGVLAADHQVFWDAWGINGFVQREHSKGQSDTTWFDWYVIP